MARVLADVRADTEAARREEGRRKREEAGEVLEERGQKRRMGRDGGGLEVPRAVVEEGVKLTRECLEAVVEVEP